MSFVPETKYAKSGNVHIAYQVIGGGSLDLVFVHGWISHIEHPWEEPSIARCACAIRGAVRPLGLAVHVGVHTGECEVIGPKIGGLAVHIGARVTAAAGADDVLVSSTVKDLVAGSGLRFEDRGPHALKGVPGEWRLFAVASERSA